MYYVSVDYTLMHKSESETLNVHSQNQTSLLSGVQRSFTIIITAEFVGQTQFLHKSKSFLIKAMG